MIVISTQFYKRSKQLNSHLTEVNDVKFKIVFLGPWSCHRCQWYIPRPQKTKAIRKMKPPTNVTELRRVMGMINQLNKFSSHIAQFSQPLQELLESNNTWMWTSNHDEAFHKLKMKSPHKEFWIIMTLMLKQRSVPIPPHMDWELYSYSNKTIVSRNQWHLPRIASVTLKAIMQIEKEGLALVWSYEKFADYVLGKPFIFETDHKPLVPLLDNKWLDSLPPRVLRF